MQGKVPASPDEPAIQRFLRMFDLAGPAVLLPYQDHGYGSDWCHVSAKHRAINEGGKRVHGWALWDFEGFIVGDHHSVWETAEGELVDVTPPKCGADQVLFVRDDAAKIEEQGGAYQLFTNRTADPQFPFLWQGNSTIYTHWSCPPNKSDLVDYCAQLDIPVSAILTDDQHG
jgi:hypothetical protein